MKTVSSLLLPAALLLAVPSASLVGADTPEAELGPWKAVGKLRLPGLAVGMALSEDKRRVVVMCLEKQKWDSGGITTGFVEVHSVRCYAADSGKEIVASGISRTAQRMALRGNRLAISDASDKVAVYDLASGKKIQVIDSSTAINKMLFVDDDPKFGYEFGPAVQFVDDGKAVRVLLNDAKTILYRDAKTGAKIKTPASEAMKFAGAQLRVLALSSDRRLAVTAAFQPSDNYTIWQRDLAKKK